MEPPVDHRHRVGGGIDPDRRRRRHLPGEVRRPLAKNRIITDPDHVIERQPDLVMASWCGKKVQLDQIRRRPGWTHIPAIRDGQLHEIDSAIILQPGPAVLTDGVETIHRIIAAWAIEHTR